MKLNNKFAIGCLVQWYEIEMIEEYLQSVRNSLDLVDNKENVKVHLTLTTNQKLEKINGDVKIEDIVDRFKNLVGEFDYEITDELYTIADYRRWFNDYYCETVDV